MKQTGNMNRAQRRKYDRTTGRTALSVCPSCRRPAQFVAVPTTKWLCDVKCERCGAIVARDNAGLVPFSYCTIRERKNIYDGRNEINDKTKG